MSNLGRNIDRDPHKWWENNNLQMSIIDWFIIRVLENLWKFWPTTEKKDKLN